MKTKAFVIGLTHVVVVAVVEVVVIIKLYPLEQQKNDVVFIVL
jgi:hypothetical protein